MYMSKNVQTINMHIIDRPISLMFFECIDRLIKKLLYLWLKVLISLFLFSKPDLPNLLTASNLPVCVRISTRSLTKLSAQCVFFFHLSLLNVSIFAHLYLIYYHLLKIDSFHLIIPTST